MSDIKAIETQYKGYRFRSRLEARWAVFFDKLGVGWEYEKQGYALPSGPYLPDFWLPSIPCWVEIKPEQPTELESNLAGELGEYTGHAVYIFCGLPSLEPDYEGNAVREFPDWDNGQMFTVCGRCATVGVEYEARSDRLPCKECYACMERRTTGRVIGPCEFQGGCEKRCQRSSHGDRGHTYGDYGGGRYAAAVKAARSARFEFGESGGPR